MQNMEITCKFKFSGTVNFRYIYFVNYNNSVIITVIMNLMEQALTSNLSGKVWVHLHK